MIPSKIKFLLIFLTLFLSINYSAICQKNFTKEIGIISDNDLYVTTFRDRYYTNGTFLYFRFLQCLSNTQGKKIHEIQIGQQMYTPNKAQESDIKKIDRPFAGYSFINYSQLIFYENNAILKATIEIGTTGPKSLAKESQNIIHDIYGFKKSEGWDNQIANRFGIGIELRYTKSIFLKKKIDLHLESQIAAGTIFSNTNLRLISRFNLFNKKLNPNSNSILFESNLNAKNSQTKNSKELFLFLSPSVNYAFYDATIQARLENNNPMEYSLIPLTYSYEIGLKYAVKRFNLGYSIITYSKKVKKMIDDTNTYGSIKVAYKFN
ncbi:lipid A deacylase LpxR family protein [Bacteroidota bacterium]